MFAEKLPWERVTFTASRLSVYRDFTVLHNIITTWKLLDKNNDFYQPQQGENDL